MEQKRASFYIRGRVLSQHYLYTQPTVMTRQLLSLPTEVLLDCCKRLCSPDRRQILTELGILAHASKEGFTRDLFNLSLTCRTFHQLLRGPQMVRYALSRKNDGNILLGLITYARWCHCPLVLNHLLQEVKARKMATSCVIDMLLRRLYVLGMGDFGYLQILVTVANSFGVSSFSPEARFQICNRLPPGNEYTVAELREAGEPIKVALAFRWRKRVTPLELWEVYGHEDVTEYEIFALISVGLDDEGAEDIWNVTSECLREAMKRCRSTVLGALSMVLQDGDTLTFRRLEEALPEERELLFTDQLKWSLREAERYGGSVVTLSDLFNVTIERMSELRSGLEYEFHRARLLRILEAPQRILRKFRFFGDIKERKRKRLLQLLQPSDASAILDGFGLDVR